MKRIFFTLIGILYANIAFSQSKNNEPVNKTEIVADKPAEPFIMEIRDIVKQNSLFRDKLNWNAIDENIKKLSVGMKTTNDTKPVIDYIISELRKVGDKHSFFMSIAATTNYSNPTKKLEGATSKLLPGDIGYINVPHFGSVNDSAMTVYAQNIQNLIKDLDTKNNIKGWIIDLRKNTGGNMYPMITGLGPLLDKGTLGYFVSNNKKNPWKLMEKGEKMWSSNAYVPNAYKLKKRPERIALLVGGRTASSGEFTVVSFIGQNNIRLFGQPTAGYTTGNRTYVLSNGSSLMLSISNAADRDKKDHIGAINPDVLVEQSVNKDADLEAASKWVLGF
ncbi:S41 family peptidase [Elizabethkingia ursingii]